MPSTPLSPTVSRYDIGETLGWGAMGVVYAAYDRELRAPVALKMIPCADGDLLYRLKSEFRALQGIYHPNLVRLGELVVDGDSCFFTMELVRGTDLLSHVRRGRTRAGDTLSVDPQRDAAADTMAPDRSSLGAADTIASTPPAWAADTVAAATPPSSHDVLGSPVTGGRLREERLRGALGQIASGLVALHDAGRVHRDLKPSNVLVADDDRVVILDFGLATNRTLGLGAADPAEIAGTPAYMAPEQAAGSEVTPAADWYSVGVMLYQALEGRLPFTGTFEEVLAAKRASPPPLGEAARAQFPDLAELCERLLAPAPQSRPKGDAVLAALGAAPTATAPAAHEEELFVGRTEALAELADALCAARAGACVVQLVAGPAGIGKSALARAFLRDAELGQGAVVLPARCYERESVRYKALDGAVDALSRYLRTLPSARRQALLPEDAALIARLFPVLERVPGVPVGEGEGALAGAELRIRGFAALRELLSRIARDAPIALFIDDIQWADADSFALLQELVRPPDPPPLLIVATLREAEHEADADAETEPTSWLNQGIAANVRRLELGPLAADDGEALARSFSRLGDRAGPSRRIAREAAGHPLLVQQLARAGLAAQHEPGEVSLENLFRESFSELPPRALAVLKVLAVAGQPLSRNVAAEASALDRLALEHAIESLEAHHLARHTPLAGDRGIEPFHARVREVVLADLNGDERASLHRELAGAFEACEAGDAEVLARHYLEAGERDRAAGYAARAAREAAAVLAFDRSARLYRLALDLTSDPAKRRDLYEGLAEALVGLGRSAEAAQSYLASAEGASPDVMLERRRRAAEHLLTSGRIGDGLAVVDDVLARLGMPRRPRTPLGALAAMIRARLKTRALGRRPRGVRRRGRPSRVRVDACYSAWQGLSIVDPMQAEVFLARHNELAFSSGDPHRVSRALLLEAALVARSGPKRGSRLPSLMTAAQQAMRDIDDAALHAFLELTRAITSFNHAQWRAALAAFERAETLYERCVASAWETGSLHLFRLNAWGLVGDFREIAARGPDMLRDAYARDDLFFAISLRCGILPWTAMIRGDAAEARRDVEDALAQWGRVIDVPHVWSIVTVATTHLYEGDGRAALDLISRSLPRLRRRGLLSVHVLRVPLRHHRACAALAAAESERGMKKRRLLALASRDARALARERATWTRGLSLLVRAGVSAEAGEPARATPLLERAITAFEDAEMAHLTAAAKIRLGTLLGGDAGAALRAAADAWAASQNVREPDRLWRLWAPGFR